ncbi:MAG: hypothetical protein CMM61_09480 [Rhodospirillaceae bacterium]|nr:hypothetical protein [Rhodospirillaceae bacterium]
MAQAPDPNPPAISPPKVSSPDLTAPDVSAPDPAPAATEGSRFQAKVAKAFEKSGLFKGLDLEKAGENGKARSLTLPKDRGSIEFFYLPDGSEEQDTEAAPEDTSEKPAAAPAPSEGAPTPAPVTTVETVEPGAAPVGAAAPGATVSEITDDTVKGSYHFIYKRDDLPLNLFAENSGKTGAIDLILKDVVMIYSSEERDTRLAKLKLDPGTGRFLRKFITTKRRAMDLPAGGLVFARLIVKDNPFLDKLDRALDFKEREVLVRGELSYRMFRRLAGLPVPTAKPDVTPDDLSLSFNLEGFRPPKIGRYVDASDVALRIAPDKDGRVDMTGSAAARFGFGARKVKARGVLDFDAVSGDGEPVFRMTAKAGERDLRNIKVDGAQVTVMDFLFSLDDDYTPKLRAEGFGEQAGQRIPIAGELDEEDGRNLFKLDGNSLEAIAGLDIPGLDEIKLPTLPKLTTGRAVAADTVVRGQPAKVIIGPITNNDAAYVGLSVDGGGLETLVPTGALGDLGQIETGRALYLYLPKGRAPPRLADLPPSFRPLFEEFFTEEDLAAAKPGLNLFQASDFAEKHPFNRLLSLFRRGETQPGSIRILGQVDPLVFDEPEDSVSETWGRGEAKSRLKRILASLRLRGRVEGLNGIGLGSLFRLADRAEFAFEGTKSGKVTAGLDFGGTLKMAGASAPRRFEFAATGSSGGAFSWRGDEVDAKGEDVRGGQRIMLSGVIKNRRLEAPRIQLAGRYRLGDLLPAEVPGLADLELQDVFLSRGVISAALGRAGARSGITIVDKPGVAFAVIDVSRGVRPAAYLPGLDRTPLADLELPETALLIAGEGTDATAVDGLPPAMAAALKKSLRNGGIDLAPGISFLSRLGFDGGDPLARLARRLGVPANETAFLSGKIPASVVKAIAGGARPKSVAGLSLTAQLPRLTLPGLDKLFKLSEVTRLNLAPDDAGVLGLTLTSGGTFTVPIVNREEQVALTARITGKGAERLATAVILAGDAKAPKLNLTAEAPLDFKDLKKAKDFVVTVDNGLTLSDLLGTDVPGIGNLRLAEAKLSLGHVRGTLALGETTFTVNLAALGGGGGGGNPLARLMTLEVADLPGLKVIPGLGATPLADVSLNDLVFAYVPALPGLGGGGSGGLSLDALPDPLKHLKDKLALPSGSGGGGLLPGLNLASALDPAKLGKLSDLLGKLGAGNGKPLKLRAVMPGEVLAFIRDKLPARKKGGKGDTKKKIKALARTAVAQIVKRTNLTIPIPAIKLPGVGDYLSSRKAEIAVKGAVGESGEAILTTSIAGTFDFALPGTPTSGSLDHEIAVTLDTARNLKTALAGTGKLDNVGGTLELSGSLEKTDGDKRADLALKLDGDGLTLANVMGLNVPGVSDVALTKASVRAGLLSAEITLKEAAFTATAFDFAKGRAPILALTAANLDAGQLLPALSGSVLDAAVLERSTFLFLPQGRKEGLAEAGWPEELQGRFDLAKVGDGFNADLAARPKPDGQLADFLGGLGIRLAEPLDIEGRFAANPFTAAPKDLLAAIDLKAALPKLSFDKIGAVVIDFPDRPVLALKGTDKGLATRIDTAIRFTLPALRRSYQGEGSFTTAPGEDGRRMLAFAGSALDTGGRRALIEASMALPGSPRDFRLKFSGEQTLSSLLGVDIPVIGDLALKEVERDPDFLVAKIALKGFETTVGAFKTDGRWAVTFSAEGLKPSEFIPGLDGSPLAGLTLPRAAFTYIPKRTGDGTALRLPFDMAGLPDKVRSAVGPLLSPFGGGGSSFRPGLNLKSFLNPGDLPALKKMFAFAGGGGGKPLKLSGVLPVEALKSLIPSGGGGSGGGLGAKAKDAVAKLVQQVDLETKLPAVNLPGVRDVVAFGDPVLRIQGVPGKGTVALVTRIAGDMTVSLPGVSPVEMTGSLRLVARGDGVGLDVAGDSDRLRLGGSVDLNKADPRLQLTVTSDITVADLVGTSVPGIGDLALTDARIGSEIISVTLQLRGSQTPLALFDFKSDKKPFAALVPENVDAADFIPGLRGTALDNAKLVRGALVYVPYGKDAYPTSEFYPDSVTNALALVSRGGALEPAQGLRAGFILEPKADSPFDKALTFVGVRQETIEVAGALPNVVLGKGGGRGLNGDLLKQAVAAVDLEARLPAINLPGIEKVVTLGAPYLRIKGAAVPGRDGKPTGEVKLRVGMAGDLTLKLPGHDLGFEGGIDIEKATGGKAFRLALRSTSTVNWDKAFGLPFVSLNKLGLTGAIERTAEGAAMLDASLTTTARLDKQEFQAVSTLTLKSNTAPELRFTIPGRIDVANLPVVGGLKGVNELSFANLWIGTGGLGGKVRIDKLGIGGEGAIFLHGGKPVALVKADPFKITDLVGNSGLASKFKQVLEGAAQITLPESVFAISTADLSTATIGDLPAGIRPMLSGLMPKSGGDKRRLPFGTGVSLIAALSEANLPPAIRQAATRDINIFKAVDGPLLLGGSLKGVFDGNLEARLEARLPDFKLPDGQPWRKLVSLDSVGAEGFLFIDVPKLQMGLGAAGNVTLDVPRVGEPSKSDKLKFAGDLYASFDAVSWAGSFKLAAKMRGDWHQPFGISKNHTFRNPAILIGFDSEGSVEFGVGASAIMTGLGPKQDRTVEADADFLININFSTSIPLPKKLAIVLKAKGELNQWVALETMEGTFKGVLGGPMANEVLKVLPDKASRDTAKALQKEILKRSVFDIIRLDELPLPTFSVTDPEIFFATPGSKIPGRDDTLDTMGVRVAGAAHMALFGKKKRLAGADLRLTLSDGLILKGDLGDITVPPVLKVQNAKVDIVANLKQLPHFKVSGTTEFIGAKDHVDIEFSKDRIHFELERDLGRVIKTRFLAQTDSGDVLGAREFLVEADTQTEVDKLISDEVFPRMGIPKVVFDAIKSQTPLFIHGLKFRGKLVEFLKGGDVTLEIDHSFFGTRMKEPAVATVKPVWASANPVEVLPVNAIGAAMGKSFFAYLVDHPVRLGKVNLGLVSLEHASLSAERGSTSSRFKITGKVNALGLPFSETTAYLDNKTGLTLDSTTEINIGLPLGPIGNLARSETTLHYELNPAGVSHKIKLDMSTAALGFKDSIHFKLDGDLTRTDVSFNSTHPCAKFDSKATMDAGDIRNLALKLGQGNAQPVDFIQAVKFKPQINLPSPQDALKCGARVAGLAAAAVDAAGEGLKHVANAANLVVGAVGDLAGQIIQGLKSLDCKLLRLGDCPRPSDCRGSERWNNDLKRCWIRDEFLLRHYSIGYKDKGWCADIRGAKDKWGQEIIPWSCHGKWNQAWRLLSDGRMQNRKGGCMAADGYREGRTVTLAPCNNWQALKMEFLETGQIIAHRQDGSGGACLAIHKDKVVLWGCDRVGEKWTDLWIPYDPFRKKVVNPALERQSARLEAAYKTPISNDPPVPFMRYWKRSTNEYYHTADPAQFGEGRDGWKYEGKVGMIFAKRAPGTVPLFRFWRRATRGQNHVYTTDPNPFRGGQRGFNFDGVAGYVYNREIPNTVPFYRYHESDNTNYYYTGDIHNLGTRPGRPWRYEGVAGYLPKEEPPLIPPVEPSNPVPLAFDNSIQVFPKPAEGTVPLYLYGKIENRRRKAPDILALDFNERGYGSPAIYYAGVAGYVFKDKRSGTVPVTQRQHGKTDGLGYAPGPDFGPGKDARIVNAQPVPLLRYFNPKANDHLYTADPDQLGDGRDGYVRDGVAGAIFPGRVKGSVPLYRYWNGAKQDHIFTTDFQDLWYGKDGYDYVAVEGYVYPMQEKGTKALHRYRNGSTNDNLLTTDFDEFGGKRGARGFAYVKVEGWVPRMTAPGAREKAVKAAPEMMLRYRNGGTGDHVIAAGFGTMGEGANGYALDAPLGMIFTKKAKDTVPLYSYWHAGNKDTYYTADFDGLAWGKDGWSYQGIAGWIYDKERPGTVALRVYHSSAQREHMLARDGGGKSGYTAQGIVGWVPEFKAPGTDTPVAKSTPQILARYVNAKTRDARLTAGDGEFGQGAGGYLPDRYLGYIWPRRDQGLVPLYRYFNAQTKDTYVATDFSERWYGTEGYVYEGILGYVLGKETAGAVALHRYVNDASRDTRVTTYFTELDGKSGRDGYRYQGIIGWVNPFVPPGLDQPEKPSDPVPFVRYRDAKTGAWLLTAGPAFGAAKGDLKIDRAQGRVFTTRAPGTVPLYEYAKGKGHVRRYATDFGEFLFGKEGFGYLGIAGFVYPKARAGAEPFVRFATRDNGGHVLAVDKAEFTGKGGYAGAAEIGFVPAYSEEPSPEFRNLYIATNDNFSCLSAKPEAGGNLESMLCAENGDMRFTLWSDGTLRHDPKDLCLGTALKGGKPDEVGVYTCDYSPGQQWDIRWTGKRPARPDPTAAARLVHKQSGRCLGLADASGRDEVEAQLIICSVGNDPAKAGPQVWAMDKAVPKYVLPGTDAPVQAAPPQMLVRYVNPKAKGADHRIVKGFDEIGRGKDGFIPDVLMGRIHPTRAQQGMTPLYRYVSAAAGDTMYTADFLEMRFATGGYRYDGVLGYVQADRGPGLVALHRYYNKSKADHLVTTNLDELDGASGKNGYRYEGIAAYTPDTGAEVRDGWGRVYLANLGGMVCLNRNGDRSLGSRRCEDEGSQALAFWSDGTLRDPGGTVCLTTDRAGKTAPEMKPCDNNLTQRWVAEWQGGKAPAVPGGKAGMHLAHWLSGACVTLADGSGRDDIAAVMAPCEKFAKDDRRATWWPHVEPPEFVAPGTSSPVVRRDPVPLVRYVNPKAKSGDRRLTAGAEALGLGKDGYAMETAQGYVWTGRAPDTAPLYQYVNTATGDHFWTPDFRELGWGAEGYDYTGVAGYLYAEQRPGTVALHRYVNSAKGDHVLTADADEFGGKAGRGGYAYQGIAAWAPRYPEDPIDGYKGLYLATNKNLSCLDGQAKLGAPVTSSFCHDHKGPKFSFWQDGTLRFEDAGKDGTKLCLDAGKGGVVLARCAYTRSQQFTPRWQGAFPAAVDPARPLQIVQADTGKCLALKNASGQDGVVAVLEACKAPGDTVQTWSAGTERPVFTAPGMEIAEQISTPLPFIRYANPKAKGGDHLMQAGPKPFGLGKNGYEMQTAQGFIFKTRAPGTQPLYRYRDSKTGDTIYTGDFHEFRYAKGTTAYDGWVGYAYGKERKDAVALHRYHNKAKGDHLLTAHPARFGGKAGKDGYVPDGVVAWVPPYDETPNLAHQGQYAATHGNLTCLDAEGKDGGPLLSSYCGKAEGRHLVSLWNDGTLRQDASGLCLSLRTPNKGGAKGAEVTLDRCDYTRAQQWSLGKPGRDKALKISHTDSAKCLGIADASGQDGVETRAYPCGSAAPDLQSFTLTTERPEFVPPGMELAEAQSTPLPFIRYVNRKAKGGDHLMQAGPEPFGLGKDGYEMQTAQGFIFTTRAPGTQPLYRYKDSKTGDTIYTGDFHEFRYTKGSVSYDGWVGYAYGKDRKGAVPLHRYANKARGDHLLTAYPDRFGGKSGKDGYAPDGIVAWVPPYDETPDKEHQAVFAATHGNLTCLDAEGTDGGPLLSSYCGKADGKHLVTFWKDGTLRQDASGLCLSLRTPSKGGKAGAVVTVDRCDYTRSQQWILGKPDRDKALKISHTDSAKCLGIADGSGQDGVETRAYGCTKGDPDLQSFTLTTGRPEFIPPGMDAPIAKSAPVPLVRYARSGGRPSHLFKLGPEDWETGREGYTIEVPQGTILPKRAAKTVPLYRYRHGGRDQVLHVSDFLDYRFAKDGYVFDGVLGYVLAEQAKGAVALRRYRHGQSGDDLLTIDRGEYGGDRGRGGYVFLGVQGWVEPYRAVPVTPVSAVAAVTKDWFCLAGPEAAENNRAVIMPCAPDRAATFTYFDDDSLREDAGGRCLTFENDRMPATWADCVYRDPRQRLALAWTGKGKPPEAADGTRPLGLRHVETKRCAALQQGKFAAGTPVILQNCAGKDGRDDQNWHVMAALPRAKALAGWTGLSLAGGGGLCVNPPTGRGGAQVTLQTCLAGRGRATFARYDDGTLRHEATGTCLSIPPGRGGSVTAELRPCLVNSPTQVFEILWNAPGKAPKAPDAGREFRLRLPATGQCLGVRGGTWAEGGRAALTRCAKARGAPTQNWRLEGEGTQ